MNLIIRQGRIVDPSQMLDQVADLIVEDGCVAEIAAHIRAREGREIRAAGLIVAPGFVDMHVHLREPGREDAETIESGTRAAARGGFTAVACMPNTQPVNDSVSVTSFILERARAVSRIPVYPIGAITSGSQGQTLVDVSEMARAGVVAISDDGRGVQNNQVMRRAMEAARQCDLPVIDHCEDKDLAAGGCLNEGPCAARLGRPGINPDAEEIQVVRDAILARRTGARVHIAHISTRHALAAVKRARQEGVAITCEVTPHHLLLTEDVVPSLGTNAKMNPPLRARQDVDALGDALASGDIDAIATDHAPHTEGDKRLEFDRAPFGIVGLETAVSLIWDRFVRTGMLSIARMVEVFSVNPSRILRLKHGTLARGEPAHITILDPELRWEVRSSEFLSSSRNTPYEGWQLQGGPVATLVRGEVVWRR